MSGNPDFDRELGRLQAHMPKWAQPAMARARNPAAVWFRVPLALGLIVGGIVGIVLPILGFWMTPLGIALLALDVPFLRRPLARLLAALNNRLTTD